MITTGIVPAIIESNRFRIRLPVDANLEMGDASTKLTATRADLCADHSSHLSLV